MPSARPSDISARVVAAWLYSSTDAKNRPNANVHGAYERSPPPKYYVEIAATSHAGWLDPAGPGRKEIVEYAVAFLDCYAKGMPESSLLRSTQPGLVELRRDVPADPNDVTAESLRNDRDSRARSI